MPEFRIFKGHIQELHVFAANKQEVKDIYHESLIERGLKLKRRHKMFGLPLIDGELRLQQKGYTITSNFDPR